MKIPSFMRNSWWWVFYLLTMVGAVGFVVSTAFFEAPVAVWAGFAIAAQAGAVGVVIQTYRLTEPPSE